MKFSLRNIPVVISIILLVIYSAFRERIPDFYNGIVAGVAIGLLVLNIILLKRKQQ